jgi:septum formation protein
MNTPIILASKSPRRKQLLEWAEVPFEIMSQDTAELIPGDTAITDIPISIAFDKAQAVLPFVSRDRIVLAADTVVVLDDSIIGKPADEEEAIKTLKKLSGRIHQVITGVVLMRLDQIIKFSDISLVEFYPLTDDQISFYVKKYTPFDKAGAYAIQEWIGVVGIKCIHGDFYNVMGLPVSRVVQALASF